MSVARIRIVAQLAAALSFAPGCADTDDGEPTSEEQQSMLSVAGDGMPSLPKLVVPKMPALPSLPAPKPLAEDLRDPLGPAGLCDLRFLKIYDPVRAKPIEVPVVVCN